MSMSQDWDLDTILQHSRSLKIDDNIAIKKYYDIYKYLKNRPDYISNDSHLVQDSVTRTMTWLCAYANVHKQSPPKKEEKETNQ